MNMLIILRVKAENMQAQIEWNTVSRLFAALEEVGIGWMDPINEADYSFTTNEHYPEHQIV